MERKGQKRLIWFCGLVLLSGFTFFYHSNRLRPSIYAYAPPPEIFNQGHDIPLMLPRGVDFKCLHEWSVGLRKEGIKGYLEAGKAPPGNVYPPAFTFFLAPLAAKDLSTSYPAFTWLLLACLFVAALFTYLENSKTYGGSFFLSVVSVALLNHSYPVLFSIERGNSDLIAAASMATSLYFLSIGRPYWAVALLSVGTQAKIYPAVLLTIIAVRAGIYPVLAFSLLNSALLFILGVEPAKFFVENLGRFSADTFIWPGNHSLKSFLHQRGLESLLFVAQGLALTFLGGAWLRLLRLDRMRGPFSTAELGLIGMCFQLMVLLPSTSHDYRAAILFIPFGFLISRKLEDFALRPVVLLALAGTLALSLAEILAPTRAGFGIKTYSILISLACYAFIAFKAEASRTQGSVNRA